MKYRIQKGRLVYHATEEDLIQIKYFNLVRLYKKQYEELNMVFSVPNGLPMSASSRNLAIDTGLTAGIPDVSIDIPRGSYPGAKIEFKSKKGVLSSEQRRYKKLYEKFGWLYVIYRDAEEAWEFTLDYIGLLGLKNFHFRGYN